MKTYIKYILVATVLSTAATASTPSVSQTELQAPSAKRTSQRKGLSKLEKIALALGIPVAMAVITAAVTYTYSTAAKMHYQKVKDERATQEQRAAKRANKANEQVPKKIKDIDGRIEAADRAQYFDTRNQLCRIKIQTVNGLTADDFTGENKWQKEQNRVAFLNSLEAYDYRQARTEAYRDFNQALLDFTPEAAAEEA